MRGAAGRDNPSKEEQGSPGNGGTTAHQRDELPNGLLQTIYDAAPVGIAYFDRDMRLIDFNAEYQIMIDPRIALSLGTVLYEVDPAALARKPIYDRVFAGESVNQENVPYPYSDEEVRYRDARYRPVRDASGQVVGLVSVLVNVTDKKRAIEALQKSEKRFRSYFELGLIGMAITSPIKGILEVNDEICQILGYERAELLRMTWADVTHPDDLAADEVLFNRVMSGEIDAYSIDKRWVRKGGQAIDSHISVKCLRRADNSVDYFVALLQDITERKRAEQALRESEARFRAVADLVPDILWSRNVEGTIEWYNQRWIEYTGQSSEEAAGFGWLRVVHPDDQERSLKSLQAALASGQPLRQERRIQGVDGSYRWFLVQMQPLHDAKGAVIHWFAAATDVHEQRRTREELKDSVRERTAELAAANAQAEMRRKRLYDTIMEIPAVIGVLNGPEHRYALVNPTFLNTMDKRAEDVIGKTFEEVFPEAHVQGWNEVADRVYQTGQPHIAREALGLLGRRGADTLEETYWNSVAWPLRDARGEIEGIITYGVEVTDQVVSQRRIESLLSKQEGEIAARKSAVEELHVTNARLRGLSGRLLTVQEEERHTVARELHDEIGQQLTALRFMLDGPEQTYEGKALQLAGALAIVDTLTERVRELSLDLRPSILDDAGLWPGLLWHAERYTAQTGIKINLAHRGLQERLPAALETAIYRIVQEALTNVARHAEVRQVTVQLLVDSNVTVLIEDAGKGFDVAEAMAAHVSAGLSGMRERIEMLGGQLTLESQSGEGTRVLAEIPLDSFRQEVLENDIEDQPEQAGQDS
jgi:PAS domain S-box-containing protein